MACRGRILIIDDDEDTREALAESARAVGCCAVTACDGAGGLRQLEDGVPPCLVLVDLQMPRLSGEDFVRLARRRRGGAALTIISMSADERAAAPPLVDLHLAKPFRFHELWPTIERCCRSAIWIEAEPVVLAAPALS